MDDKEIFKVGLGRFLKGFGEFLYFLGEILGETSRCFAKTSLV